MKRSRLFPSAAALACCLGFALPASAQTAGPVLTKEQIEAQYESAIKRCDGMSGEQQNLCETEAETQRDKARADLEMHETASEARDEAAEKKAKADEQLAEQRCEAMPEAEREVCRNDLAARR